MTIKTPHLHINTDATDPTDASGPRHWAFLALAIVMMGCAAASVGYAIYLALSASHP